MGGQIFCTDKAPDAFICHYIKPVEPELPAV